MLTANCIPFFILKKNAKTRPQAPYSLISVNNKYTLAMETLGVVILWYEFLKERCLFSSGSGKDTRKSNEVLSLPLEEKKIDSRYILDIMTLSEKFPVLGKRVTEGASDTSLELEIDLKEIYQLCPRNRKRSDRYDSLCKYLKEAFGVVLTIKSQKSHA